VLCRRKFFDKNLSTICLSTNFFRPTTYLPPLLYVNYFRRSDGSLCECKKSASCHIPAGFYDIDPIPVIAAQAIFDIEKDRAREFVDGWYVACWPIESLLLSTLESFYDETTLNRIITNVNSSTSVDSFTVLNASVSSRFNHNDSLNVLTKELFIENWTKILNYSSYFEQCQPQSCLYDTNERAQVLYIITSLLALYGGLTVVLRVIIPYIVAFPINRLRRRATLITQPATIVGE
jgi:hypothetical protein